MFLLAAKNNYYDNNNDYVRIKMCDTSEYLYIIILISYQVIIFLVQSINPQISFLNLEAL